MRLVGATGRSRPARGYQPRPRRRLARGVLGFDHALDPPATRRRGVRRPRQGRQVLAVGSEGRSRTPPPARPRPSSKACCSPKATRATTCASSAARSCCPRRSVFKSRERRPVARRDHRRRKESQPKPRASAPTKSADSRRRSPRRERDVRVADANASARGARVARPATGAGLRNNGRCSAARLQPRASAARTRQRLTSTTSSMIADAQVGVVRLTRDRTLPAAAAPACAA